MICPNLQYGEDEMEMLEFARKFDPYRLPSDMSYIMAEMVRAVHTESHHAKMRGEWLLRQQDSALLPKMQGRPRT